MSKCIKRVGRTLTGRGPAAGTAAGREDARLREVVLGEILDARPSTRWDDVAGLQAAKQARWAACAVALGLRGAMSVTHLNIWCLMQK